LGFRWLGIDGEHRMFSPIFGCAAVLVLMPRRTLPRFAAAGVLCALSSFFTQQRGIVALGAIGLFIIYEFGFRQREFGKMLLGGIVLAGSVAVALGLMVLPFIFTAGPEQFYRSTFLFLSNYVQDPDTNGLETYFGTISKLWTFGYLITFVAVFYYLLIPLIYIAALAGLWLKRRTANAAVEPRVLLICLLGAAFAAGTFAPNAGRLFQIAVPAVVAFGWIVYSFLPRNEKAVAAVLAVLIVFGAFRPRACSRFGTSNI
jgi:hypothetical protein